MRFKIFGLATIIDIPTEEFNSLTEDFISNGWVKKSEYAGFDAWIDYGFMKLKKNSIVLKFEWDIYGEGSIEGPINTITKIAKEFGYSVHSANRWDLN